MTKEYIGREEKCGDCIHVEICERNPILTEFSRENPAYCKKIMKAADVAPVRHGRWLCVDTDTEQFFLCNRCNKKEYWESNYCPNCGAKMDEEWV